MTFRRSEVWLADLNPTRGSEQAGTRPVLIFQNDLINKFTTTVLTIPFTTNLRRELHCHPLSKYRRERADSRATRWPYVTS